MKITDCIIRTRTIVAGVIFCILFAVLWTLLAQPLDVTASSGQTYTLQNGTTKADPLMEDARILLPEGNVILDLDGQDVSVHSIAGNGSTFTLQGDGSLTVKNFVRLPESDFLVKLGDKGSLTTNGIYMKDGTLEIGGGLVTCGGSYTQAAHIRITGGSITANTTADGLRAEDSFFISGGTVESTGRTHGLHADGEVRIEGGHLTLQGANAAFYFANPQEVTVYDGASLTAGSAAQNASAVSSVDGAEGRTYVTIGAQTAANPQKAANAQTSRTTTNPQRAANTQTSRTTANPQRTANTQTAANTQSSRSRTGAATQASVAVSTQTAANAQTSQTRTAATTQASVAVSTQASNAASTQASNAGGTQAAATTQTSVATGTQTAASAQASTTATTQSSSSANVSTSSAALPVSAAGSASSASSSSAASGATSFIAPATADSGLFFYGIILLAVAVCGLIVLVKLPSDD